MEGVVYAVSLRVSTSSQRLLRPQYGRIPLRSTAAKPSR